MSEDEITITPKPETVLKSSGKPIIDPNTNKPVRRKVGRPRTRPIVKPEDKRPVGRPRTKPLGPAKAKGEKRVMTKARAQHLEKMRVALRASRARKKEEKRLQEERSNNIRRSAAHEDSTKRVETDNVANPGRQTTEFIAPAPKPDYNQPTLETSESILSRGLERDHFHSDFDVQHHSFFLSGHPSGVSYPGGSGGASAPPIVGTPAPSVSRGSGTGDIANNNSGSFFL